MPSKESSQKAKHKKYKKKHSHHRHHSDKNRDQDIETTEAIDTTTTIKDSSRLPCGVESMAVNVQEATTDQAITILPEPLEHVSRIDTINAPPQSVQDDQMDTGFADSKHTLRVEGDIHTTQ